MSSPLVIPSARRFVILSGAKDLLFRWSLIFAFAATTAVDAADVPYLSGRVVDNAEILKAETRTALTEKLKAHEQKTTDQIAVLTVPTIGAESIEEYATRVFDAWKLGQKGKDRSEERRVGKESRSRWWTDD